MCGRISRRWRGWSSALVIAVFVYHMPAPLAGMAAVNGAAFGLFPIGWIVLNAIFIYNSEVETGQFEVLQQQIAGVSRRPAHPGAAHRVQLRRVHRGRAGFGAPVAITGALMIGLGFKPLEAAKLALIGNTAPVAFGSLGMPLTTLADITGLDLHRAQRDGRAAAAGLLADRAVLAGRRAGRAGAACSASGRRVS